MVPVGGAREGSHEQYTGDPIGIRPRRGIHAEKFEIIGKRRVETVLGGIAHSSAGRYTRKVDPLTDATEVGL